MPFFILFAIPAMVGLLCFKFLSGITWKEMLLQLVAQAAIAGLSVWAIYSANTSDQAIWHGVVTGKEQVRVSCEHSYPCRCRTVCSGSGKTRSCGTRCDTCYHHTNDWDWRVYSSINDYSNIQRIDRRGSNEPPRWTAVRIGEPYALEKSYTNYIKAAPGSLFKRQGLAEKYAGRLPEFPDQVYDYYRHNSLVLANGARVADPRTWNQGLAEINAKLGKRKEVDIVVVLVRDMPQEWFYALEQHWIGGKNNAAVLVVGIDNAMTPKWSTVMAWTDNKLFGVQLRDAVMDLPTITPETVLPVLEREVVRNYKRKPMSDFEYLASSIAPTPGQWAISMVIGLLVCLGLTWFFHRHDVFGDEGVRYGFNSRRW